MRFIDCGDGSATKNFVNDPTWDGWKSNVNSTACFTEEGFPYGIYNRAVNLTTQNSIITRYVYSLFWGFQLYIPYIYLHLYLLFLSFTNILVTLYAVMNMNV